MSETTIQFLGHTSILLKAKGEPILFDPQFSPKLFGLERQEQAVIPLSDLLIAQAIFISNAHLSRLDFSSMKFFRTHTPLYAPKGLKSFISRTLPMPVTELQENEVTSIGEFEIIALATKHLGARFTSLFYSNALNFLIRWDGGSVFYGTDSSYGPHFTQIGEKYHPEVAILPIGHIGPDAWTGSRYLSPSETLKAFQDLGAKILIPNAWGAFATGKKNATRFVDELRDLSDKENLSDKIKILHPGESFALPHSENKVVPIRKDA